MNDYDSFQFRKFNNKSELDKAIHSLEGILKGIVIDNQINNNEIIELKHWYNENIKSLNFHSIKELSPFLEEIINNQKISNNDYEDLLWYCKKYSTPNYYFDIITSDIQKLEGIIHGILADNIISDDEINGLQKWLNDNQHLAQTYPYEELNSLITSILSDKKITEEEKNTLKLFFSQFIDLNKSTNIKKEEIDRLKEEIKLNGICSLCPEIEIKNKIFCFTGKSSKTNRKEIGKLIESKDGIFKDNISNDTNYLVVGNESNPCWAFSCYGRKVEKAVELRKNGNKIMIIHENDFWDYIEDLK